MSAAVIQVHDLRKTYRDGLFGRRRFEALKGVSLSVGRGEVFGLLGPNGAGKTTFIKILLGIIGKSGGSATMLDRPAGDRIGRQRVGYLPENLRIPRHHTALSALEYYGQLSGMPLADIRARAGSLLEQVGLADRRKDSVKKYSKGMLQRLGLAQALLHEPELLMLDEPTDGLDPLGRSQVRSLLRDLKQSGKTVFLNSHLLQEVEMVCDRVAILDKGMLRGLGTVDELAPQRTEGVELVLTLQGAEGAIREALASRSVSDVQRPAADQLRLVVRLENQAEVDQCVDALRARRVSIMDLSRRRISLEDAFLHVLARPVEPS